jgi:hypothetical protein
LVLYGKSATKKGLPIMKAGRKKRGSSTSFGGPSARQSNDYLGQVALRPMVSHGLPLSAMLVFQMYK